MVYNEREELVTQFGPVEYCMHDSKNVSQTVDSPNIEESQSYSLTVQVDIYAQTVTSYRHNFGKLRKAIKLFLTRMNVKENYHC